jgi:hypothetical protein
MSFSIYYYNKNGMLILDKMKLYLVAHLSYLSTQQPLLPIQSL